MINKHNNTIMDFVAYNILPEAIAFGADNMVVVATYMKSSAGPILHRNKRPATSLFNNIVPILNGTEVEFKDITTGKIVAILENATNDGALWRYYNSANKENADMILLLVKGNNNDMYYCNPSAHVEVTDGIATIFNTTIVNGVSYDKVPLNRDINSRGCMWAVYPITNGKYGSLDYIACGNRYDFNRGSGRLQFCKITKRTDVAKTVDFKGTTDLTTLSADWVWKANEIADSENETISFSFWHGVKMAQPALIIPINQIL